ncbi:MAG: shikimate dehydrogenase [Planctomycetaceae bacterium]
MICVTIGRTRHRMVLEEHAALKERGAELVELRLDWLGNAPDLARLLGQRPTAVVVTCRRPDDGGRWRGTEEQRMVLLRQAILSGAEYVDLELDVAGKVPRYGKTKRIVSYHNFQETPADLAAIHEQLTRHDPDIVKIVTMANSPIDNIRMLQLVASAKVPTVGFCMGEFGLVSRILCGKYGSPFTFATFSKERVMAPGQLSFEEMRDIYRYDEISRETKVFGVLGDPIGHSLSPLLHNTAFRHEKIDAVYMPFRVPAEQFNEVLKAFEKLDVQGYSITIPHKQAAADFAAIKTESVTEIGAANTLFRDERGRWVASNTDYDAAMSTIRLGLGDESLSGKRVLMLGAGGVARAIGLGCVRAGAVLTIANRSKKSGQALAGALGCQHVTWENRGAQFADVLINCTPIGMYPEMNATPFEMHWLRDNMLVFDTIYNPENTLLIKEAREHGCRVASGLEMFVRQAAAQFERFAGRPAPLDFMRDTLRRGISPIRVN